MTGSQPPLSMMDDAPSGKKRLPPIFWIVLALFMVFLLAGMGLVAYYVLLTTDEDSVGENSDVWDNVTLAELSTGLAVWPLADVSLEDFYRHALAADAVETATATAISTMDLPAHQRLGWLTVLARRQALNGDIREAEMLYQVTEELALLEPSLTDSQSAEALLAVARGWADMGRVEALNTTTEILLTIAQRSPELTQPARRRLLTKTAEAYEIAGLVDEARAVDSLPTSSSVVFPVEAVNPLLQLTEPPIYPDNVQNAVNVRKAQAQTFVDAWIQQEGESQRGLIADLEAALIDEDLVRSAFYQQYLQNENLTPQQRAATQLDLVRWLLIKYRVARGLLGDVQVADWTAERQAIENQLGVTYYELMASVLAFIDTLPADQQPSARLTLYQSLLAWARLGLYPGADEISLANAMNDSMTQWLVGSGLYPVAIIDEEGEISFWLQAFQPAQG